MTLRERILSVYRGSQPDVVPYMLDLSHWFYHRNRVPWDISKVYVEPERDLIDFHRRTGAGFYMPNLAAFYSVSFPSDVTASCEKRTRTGKPEIVWRIETPEGCIERARAWEDHTYAWGISQWGIRCERDLAVFASAMSRRAYTPHWDRYRQWDDYVGDCGVVYVSAGYSAIGHLMNYWMGIEAVVYAAADWPDLLREVVDASNNNALACIDLLCESPAEIVIMGDNFSSDYQPPQFFEQWSRPYYKEAIARLHRAGKYVAIHIDGKLRGAIDMFRDIDADCADAVTPTPMGDLTPAGCRAEAGPNFILSGGVSPDLWMPSVPLDMFKARVKEWLEQKNETCRFIANAGDQVPPDADEQRITIMRDLVETYGAY